MYNIQCIMNMGMAADRFNAEPGPKLFKDPLCCHNCKRGEACFTIYYNLLHFCLTLIFSVAILYPEILKAFAALGASFDLGLGGLFWFWAPNPFRRP
jgi:hypothetical protein